MSARPEVELIGRIEAGSMTWVDRQEVAALVELAVFSSGMTALLPVADLMIAPEPGRSGS